MGQRGPRAPDRQRGPRAPDRLGTAVLAVLTLGLLGAGAAWWMAAAPDRSTPATAVTELPDDPAVMAAESGPLGDGRSMAWQVPQGQSYELQWICTGSATLQLTVEGRNGSETTTFECREELSTVDIGSSRESLSVVLWNSDGRPAEVSAQLVRR